MKRILFFGMFLFLNVCILPAQPTLIGARALGAGGVEIVRWQALDSSSVETFATDLTGYLLSSSVFDAYNGNYYLGGVTASGNCLFSFNSPSGTTSSIPFSTGSNITEIDMSDGSIYTITVDSVGTFNVNRLDLGTGISSLLGVVSSPDIYGMVVDATAFDSENGILYTEVATASGDYSLCRMFVRNPLFSFELIPVLATNPQCNYSCFQFDNQNQRLIALEMDNSTGGGLVRVVEINDSTGMVNAIGPIPQMAGFVAGSSSFDQQTGTFLVTAVLTPGQVVQVAFNTQTAACTTGFMPDNTSEIVCDNYNWAQNHYSQTGLTSVTPGGKVCLYPNPCNEWFMIRLDHPEESVQVTLYDAMGRKCLDRQFLHSPVLVNTAGLPAGLYCVMVRTATTCTNRMVETY